MRIKTITKVVVCLLLCVAVTRNAAARQVSEETLRGLQQQLAKASTPTDSIQILYNIFDVISALRATDESASSRAGILETLYSTAMRAGDSEVAMDAVCNLAKAYNNEVGHLNSLIERVMDLPKSVYRSETMSFLRLQKCRMGERDTTLTPEQRGERLREVAMAAHQLSDSADIYDRMDRQLALAIYGGPLVQPKRLEQYLDSLERLVTQTSLHRSPIRNFFYTIAPVLYNEMECYDKSVATDRKMLVMLDSLDVDNIRRGRVYKHYDRNRFAIYRRLLSNYGLLDKGEAERYYSRLKELEKSLPEGEVNPIDMASVEAMYYMSQADYANALPYLRTVMTSQHFTRKPRYIKSYLMAARESGSVDDVARAQEIYIDLLRSQADQAIDEDYARMAMTYDLDQLEKRHESEKANLKSLAEHNARIATQRTTIMLLVGVGVFLVAIIIIQIVANRRSRMMARKLRQVNADLVDERDNLRRTQEELTAARDKARHATRQKSEFIHNVSHEISEPVKTIVGFTQLIVDCVPEDKRRYLNGFIEIVNENSQILQRLVGDVLDSADADRVVNSVTVSNFDVGKVCNIVAEGFEPRLSPGQELVVRPIEIIKPFPTDMGSIDTDQERFEQVLLNLVGNAVKFAESGPVVIAPVIDREKGTVTVTVTDRGPGIPAGKAEVIFEKFGKISNYSRGLGLGLFVSRRIARMLGGDITLDTSYTDGARFVFTIPVSLKRKTANTSRTDDAL